LKKIITILLVLQLFMVQTVVFAQEESVSGAPQENINAKIVEKSEPRPSLEVEADVTDPANYPLIGEGELVDYLWDSYGGYQYIFFEDVIDSDTYSDALNVRLFYGSEYSYAKDSLLTIEFFRDNSNSLEYLGETEFDTEGRTSGYLNSHIAKDVYSNSPYIYMRAGVRGSTYDEYYSDVVTFKVANPFYSSSNPGDPGDGGPDDKYAVISNESTDGTSTQSTGSFNLKDMDYSFDKSLEPSAYKMDVNKPFDLSSNEGKLIQKSMMRSISPAYNIGDSKSFWVNNFIYNSNYQINAKLTYSGTKANVWVNNFQISDADAAKLGQEFDNKIYASVTNNFAKESDVNGDGKINILIFDIQDGFTGSGGYVGGYFYAGDLYNVSYSNQSEIFYIDTYPSMGTGSTKDVTEAYETLAHEFQHMVNFNQNVLIEGASSNMDTWLNESLSMAAEQVYTGQGLSSRVNYYNVSSSIQNGHSLLYWGGDLLSNYSLSYLFGQYLKIQTNQGDRIFKEILLDPNNNYRAVENVAKKYISPDMTFGKLMTNFRIALLLKQPSGLYGFKGNPFFNALEERIYTGSSASLRGGGAVVTTFNSAEGMAVPANKGANVTYTFLDMNGGAGEVDVTPPGAPVVYAVSDQQDSVTGTAEPASTVDVKVNGAVIGTGTAGTDSEFLINIPLQKAGTELVVTATDKAGNLSSETIVVVQDVTAPEMPVVNDVTNEATLVTGTAEPATTVEVKVNGTVIGAGTAGTEGSFDIAIPVQSAGTELMITATDKTGNVSEAASVVVRDSNASTPAAPKVAELTDRENILTGTAEPSTTVIAKVAGKEIGRGATNDSGKFSIVIPVQAAGKIVEVYAVDKNGNVSPTVKITVMQKLVTLIGETRYATAVKVSQTGWKTANTVLLVNGFAIVDGLTATPLASAKDAPILLTTADSVPQQTLDEIKRLNAKEIILIGGEGVITPKVASSLTAKGYKVTRIGGLNRKDTSLLIAKELDKLVDVSTIHVAYGWGEPDALSIAAQAGLKKQPIILADKTSVPTDTLSWLKTEALANAYFIGGDGVVAPSIISTIDTIASGDVSKNRISGLNRHETNARVISKFYPQAELESILVAKSETTSLVDALAAGPLAAKLGSPVLLVSSYVGLLPEQRQVLAGKHSKYVHQIGGGVNPAALAEVVE
jgi:putative cell wall-binding protein